MSMPCLGFHPVTLPRLNGPGKMTPNTAMGSGQVPSGPGPGDPQPSQAQDSKTWDGTEDEELSEHDWAITDFDKENPGSTIRTHQFADRKWTQKLRATISSGKWDTLQYSGEQMAPLGQAEIWTDVAKDNLNIERNVEADNVALAPWLMMGPVLYNE